MMHFKDTTFTYLINVPIESIFVFVLQCKKELQSSRKGKHILHDGYVEEMK